MDFLVNLRKHYLDQNVFQGLVQNYLELEKCRDDLKETQKLLAKLAQDDMAQKFQYSNFSFSLPKYCFLSVLYANHFLNQKTKFKVEFNDSIKRNKTQN